MCRLAEIKDLNQVVNIHIAAFPGFFLTSLGPLFLMAMYRAFLLNSGGVFVVEEVKDEIHGFAVGILKSAGRDRKLALKFLPVFLIALIPGVLRNPVNVLRRIWKQLFSVGIQLEIPGGSIVLRSIGVLPDKRGCGVANRLLGDFEKYSMEKGASVVVLTTDAENNERAIRFYLKNNYEIQQKFKQDSSRSMLMMLKNIPFKTKEG